MKTVEDIERNVTRAKNPPSSAERDGRNGAFIKKLREKAMAFIIASDGMGWEHVSVHVRYRNGKGKWIQRTPTWDEMCVIKDCFWGPEERVVQYHPPKSEYVNNHQHVLHLWRPTEDYIPFPPAEMVGIKGLEVKQR